LWALQIQAFDVQLPKQCRLIEVVVKVGEAMPDVMLLCLKGVSKRTTRRGDEFKDNCPVDLAIAEFILQQRR